MTTLTRPTVGSVWKIINPQPWILRPVGARLRVTKVTDSAVGYVYLEDGGRGMCDLARFGQHAALVAD